MEINIIVRNKIAKLIEPVVGVCGNSDYVVKFDFDSEWDAFENKTARFKYNDEYIDIIFIGNECSMPVIKNAYSVEIGVYAGDLHTTTSAFLIMKKSITSNDGAPTAPKPDVYDQLMQRMNEIKAPEAVLYTKQSLTDEQKAQARDNIGAAKDNAVIYLEDSVTPTKLVQAIIENPKSIIQCLITNTGVTTGGRMMFLPYYQLFRGSGSQSFLGYAIGNYDVQNSKDMPFDVYRYTATSDMGSFSVGLTPMHENKSVLDSITGIVTADKLTLPDHPTDLVVYEAFQAAVPRVQQMNISGASVGQTIKVKTVDTDGRPTSWEAADMSGSGEVWENVTFNIPESDPVSAATINFPSANIIKACIKISLFGTLENTKFGVMVFTGGTTGDTFLSADIGDFYTTAQQIRTGAIVLEKKADFWQSIHNTAAIAGGRNTTGALRLISYNSDYLYIKTSTSNETFYGTVTMYYVIGVGGSI